MVTKKVHGSVRRLGARYGRRVRQRLGKIETLKRESKLCPYCRKEKVKRIAAGIWKCKTCNTKFAGGAYTIGRLKLETEAPEETVEEAPEEGKKAEVREAKEEKA